VVVGRKTSLKKSLNDIQWGDSNSGSGVGRESDYNASFSSTTPNVPDSYEREEEERERARRLEEQDRQAREQQYEDDRRERERKHAEERAMEEERAEERRRQAREEDQRQEQAREDQRQEQAREEERQEQARERASLASLSPAVTAKLQPSTGLQAPSHAPPYSQLSPSYARPVQLAPCTPARTMVPTSPYPLATPDLVDSITSGV
jgi:hypothetical protein